MWLGSTCLRVRAAGVGRFDLFEGAGGWCASNLEANVNDLFMTDSAQYLATVNKNRNTKHDSLVSRVLIRLTRLTRLTRMTWLTN